MNAKQYQRNTIQNERNAEQRQRKPTQTQRTPKQTQRAVGNPTEAGFLARSSSVGAPSGFSTCYVGSSRTSAVLPGSPRGILRIVPAFVRTAGGVWLRPNPLPCGARVAPARRRSTRRDLRTTGGSSDACRGVLPRLPTQRPGLPTRSRREVTPPLLPGCGWCAHRGQAPPARPGMGPYPGARGAVCRGLWSIQVTWRGPHCIV